MPASSEELKLCVPSSITQARLVHEEPGPHRPGVAYAHRNVTWTYIGGADVAIAQVVRPDEVDRFVIRLIGTYPTGQTVLRITYNGTFTAESKTFELQ